MGRPNRICGLLILLLLCSCGRKDRQPTEPLQPGETLFKLTVTVTDGIEGTPPPGTKLCFPGDTVIYLFITRPEYFNLIVKLDSVVVPSEGKIIMDRDHTLEASCERKTYWRYETPQSVYYCSPAVADDGTVYFSTGSYTLDQGWSPGTLYAFHPDGTMKWSRDLGEALFSPAVGLNGNIYIMDRTYAVHALTPDGTELWSFNQFENMFVKRDMGQRTPAVGYDGTVYIGADGLYALDPMTGRQQWHVTNRRFASKECIASPTIGPDSTIYVTIGQDSLYAIRPDGSIRWVFGFDRADELSFADPTIDDDGTIYIPTESYSVGAHLYAVRADGTMKWRHHIEENLPIRASVTIGADGTLYCTTKAGRDHPARLLALSPSGSRLWQFIIQGRHHTGDDCYSTPTVGDDGLIYFGAENGYLYAVRPDGTLAWKHEVAAGVNWSSPAITAEGLLYIGGMGYGAGYPGLFSAVYTDARGYAPSPWPRFRHDSKNSGRK